MNKNEIVHKLAGNGVSIKATGEIIDGFLSLVRESVQSGDTVTLSGFGTFGVKERGSRRLPMFSPSDKFKNQLNK